MTLRAYCTLLGITIFMVATAAEATVHRVYPGESIQAAVDAAAPGDTILVEPGTYKGTSAVYGLRISTDNLRLIGKVRKGQGDAGKVRILHDGSQETGVYAAPAGCEYHDEASTCHKQAQGLLHSWLFCRRVSGKRDPDPLGG